MTQISIHTTFNDEEKDSQGLQKLQQNRKENHLLMTTEGKTEDVVFRSREP